MVASFKRDVGKAAKNAAFAATGYGVGYVVAPASLGYYAAQETSKRVGFGIVGILAGEHAKAAAVNTALQFAPHVATAVTIGMPLALTFAGYALTGAYYLGSTAINYATKPLSAKALENKTAGATINNFERDNTVSVGLQATPAA